MTWTALPALLAHHYRGLFYIITGMVGGRYMTWSQVRSLDRTRNVPILAIADAENSSRLVRALEIDPLDEGRLPGPNRSADANPQRRAHEAKSLACERSCRAIARSSCGAHGQRPSQGMVSASSTARSINTWLRRRID